MSKTSLIETQPFKYKIVEVSEAKKREGVLMNLEGTFQRADTKNANDRVYPKSLWNKILKDEDTKERIENRRMVGELDHPASGNSSGHRVSHVITSHDLQSDGVVHGTLEVLDTPAGRIAETLFRAGVGLGISSRGDGSIERKGDKSEVQDDFRLETYDLVLKPSTPGAYPQIVESEEKAKENQLLIANAVEGLVEKTVDINVLLECHKIVSGLDSDSRCAKLLEAIKSKLTVTGESKDGNKPTEDDRTVNEEIDMSDGANKSPGSVPSLSPESIAFIEKQIASGIAEAVGKKDQDINKLNARVVELTTEQASATKKLGAAEKLIEEFQRKVTDLTESQSTDTDLRKRYDAATKIIDEAVTRLQGMGEMKRRLEAATQLLGTSIGRHKEEAVAKATDEILSDVHESVAKRLRPMLKECTTPGAVKKRFDELSSLVESVNTRQTREPLPNPRRRVEEDKKDKKTNKVTEAPKSYVVGRLLSRIAG